MNKSKHSLQNLQLLTKHVQGPDSQCFSVIERTDNSFLSNIFPNKNGDLRLVINSKDLDQFLAFLHFKMERFQTAEELMQERDWMKRILHFP